MTTSDETQALRDEVKMLRGRVKQTARRLERAKDDATVDPDEAADIYLEAIEETIEFLGVNG